MIRLEKISKYYASNDNNVSLGLHNVSVEMKKGEIIGIVGESGSGKSTFLNVCSLLDTYEDGELYYGNTPVSSFSKEEIDEFRKNHIGFIFQNYNLIDSYTVLQNVLMPLIIKGIDMKEAKERAKEIIKKVGLEHRMHHKGTKLSGGEKQRCVIARALASDSEILACDEPTGNLDSKTGREIIELIKEVAKDKLVLIVTHNYDELKDIITRRLTFSDGVLIEDVRLKDADECSDELLPNSEYKFSFKERMRLSYKDILSTPRKSILTFVIFLAISIFIAYLYTSLLTYKNSYADQGLYANVATDRYIIYKKNKEFDYDVFKNYDYNKYANFEDKAIIMDTESENAWAYFRYSLNNIKLKKGVMPTNDNEIVLGIPEKALSTCYNETMTIDLKFGSRNNNIYAKYDKFFEKTDTGYEQIKFKVVGYYLIDNSTFDSYLVSGNAKFNERIVETMLNQEAISYRTECTLFDNYSTKCQVTLEEAISDNTIKITIPKNYENKFSDVTKDIVIDYISGVETKEVDLSKYNLEVVYDGTMLECEANLKTLLSFKENGNYYLSIYERDQLKIDNMLKDIKDKGYGICSAKDAYINEDISFAGILNTILYAFFIVGVIFAFVVVFLISYFILARIYSIKNKDYTVFRTLGMSKKDMASLVRIQTVMLSLSSAVLVIILVGISYIFKHPLISGFHRIGVIGIIVYLLFMFIYSLFFAIRFNRKLYKFSVSKTFRGGVLGND